MTRGFGGRRPFGGLGDLQRLMQQAQKMQEEMAKVQEELDSLRIEASSGGGMVTATVNGKGLLLELKIRAEAIDPDDPEMLQDLVVTAVREAQSQALTEAQERMQQATGLGDLPSPLL